MNTLTPAQKDSYMFGIQEYHLYIDSALRVYSNTKELDGYLKHNADKGWYDVYITNPYKANSKAQADEICMGFIADGTEEGVINTYPSFVEGFPHVTKINHRFSNGHIIRIPDDQLKLLDPNDTARILAGNLISDNLSIDPKDPNKFTKDSISNIFYDVLANFMMTPLASECPAPIYIVELLKAFNISRDIHRLAAKAASKHGRINEGFLGHVALMCFAQKIKKFTEDEDYEPMTLSLFGGGKISSLKRHPDLQFSFIHPVLIEDHPVPFDLIITGKYNSVCGSAFPIGAVHPDHELSKFFNEEQAYLIIFNKLFCIMQPEFKTYTTIYAKGKLYFFTVDPSMVMFPKLNTTLSLVPFVGLIDWEYPFQFYARCMGETPLGPVGTIAGSNFQPLDEIYSARVMAIKEEGNRYSIYEIADNNAVSSKKKGKSRKSKNKAKGDFIGNIATCNQKTGWIILDETFLFEHPQLETCFVYSDGNRIRVFPYTAYFPGDIQFYLYRIKEFRLIQTLAEKGILSQKRLELPHMSSPEDSIEDTLSSESDNYADSNGTIEPQEEQIISSSDSSDTDKDETVSGDGDATQDQDLANSTATTDSDSVESLSSTDVTDDEAVVTYDIDSSDLVIQNTAADSTTIEEPQDGSLTVSDDDSLSSTNAQDAASTAEDSTATTLLASDDQTGVLSEDGNSYQLCGINSVVDAPRLNLIPAANKDGGFGYFMPKRENGVLVNKIGEIAGSIVAFSRDGWMCFETDYLIPRPHLSKYFVYSYHDKLWFFNATPEAELAFDSTLDFGTYNFLKYNKDTTAQLKRSNLSESDFIYEEEPVFNENDLTAAAAEISDVALDSSVALLEDSDAQDNLQSGSGNEIAVPLANAIASEASLRTANDCVAETSDNAQSNGKGALDGYETADNQEDIPLFTASKQRSAPLTEAEDAGPSPADDEDLLVSDMRLDEQVEEELKLEGGILDKIIDDAQSGSATAQASQPISNPPRLNLKLAQTKNGLRVIAIEGSQGSQSKTNEIIAGTLIGTKEDGWVLFEPSYIGLHHELQYLIVRNLNGKFEYFDACSYPDDPNFEEFGLLRFDTEYLNKVLTAVNASTPANQNSDDTDEIADVDPLDTADFDDAAAAMVDAAVQDAFEGKENFGVFARDCDPAAGCRSFLAPDGSQIDALTEHPALCLQLKHDHLSGYMLLDDKGRFAGTLVSQIPGCLCGWVRFDSEYLKLNPKLSDFHVFFDQDKLYFYPHVDIDDEDFRLYQSSPEDVEHRLMQQSADLSESEPAVAALKEMGAYTSMPCYTEIVKSRVEVESDEEFKQLCADGQKETSEQEACASILSEVDTSMLPKIVFDDEKFAKDYLESFNERVIFLSYPDSITIVLETDKQHSGQPERIGSIQSSTPDGLITFDSSYLYNHLELTEVLFSVKNGVVSLQHLFDRPQYAYRLAEENYVHNLQADFVSKYDLGSIEDYATTYQTAKAGLISESNTYKLIFNLQDALAKCPNPKVKIFGGAFVDVTLGIDELPVTGGDSYARELNKGVGGCALNVAHALRLFDIDHDLKVPLGHGPYADLVKEQLLADGYTENNFIYDDELKMDCGYCLCMVDREGERTFVVVPGIENHVKSEWFDDLDLSDTALIYISGYDLNDRNGEIYLTRLKEELSKPENKNKCHIFFDAGARINNVSRETLELLLSLNPILHLNRMELEMLTGQHDLKKGITSLASRTTAPVIVTLDKDGCCVAYKSKIYNFEIRPSPVVDATGAGDNHSAGIIGSLMKGHNLTEAIASGAGLALECISNVGARLVMSKGSIKTFKKTFM